MNQEIFYLIWMLNGMLNFFKSCSTFTKNKRPTVKQKEPLGQYHVG